MATTPQRLSIQHLFHWHRLNRKREMGVASLLTRRTDFFKFLLTAGWRSSSYHKYICIGIGTMWMNTSFFFEKLACFKNTKEVPSLILRWWWWSRWKVFLLQCLFLWALLSKWIYMEKNEKKKFGLQIGFLSSFHKKFDAKIFFFSKTKTSYS